MITALVDLAFQGSLLRLGYRDVLLVRRLRPQEQRFLMFYYAGFGLFIIWVTANVEARFGYQ